MQDSYFLKEAISLSEQSVDEGGFPAGALVVRDNMIIGKGISIGDLIYDPTSHGEIAAIRNACIHNQESNLKGCVIYTSMQPCAMCLSATKWSGITKIVYACSKEKLPDEYYAGLPNIQDEVSVICEHMVELESEALAVVNLWQLKNS